MSTKELSEKNRRMTARKLHIRKSISGTAERPRLTVFKSNKYLYVQAIDDEAGITLVAASTLEKELRGLKPNIENGTKLGELIGARLGEKKIDSILFDRSGYRYHGVVKAIADGTRKAGIKF